MNFLRSRLALVGLIVVVPAVQVVACGQKDRAYAVPGDGGDTGTGATSGNQGKAGSTPGTGGMNGVDTAGESSVGEGGAFVGEGGTGSIVIQGGAGGEPPVVDPECVPTGREECVDGLDNDCDGVTDCLVLESQFPAMNGAAAGQHVEYKFAAPAATAMFQCRASRGDTIVGGTAWRDCGRIAGTTVFPFDAATSADVKANGVWTTEVRLAFPDGGSSARFRRPVYIHNSLHAAARCPKPVSDAAYFAAAKPNLQLAGAFEPATFRNPFVSLRFDPPVNSRLAVTEADGTVDVMSLRRSFSFNADNQLLLITRTYSSRVGNMGCLAVEKRVHNNVGTWALGHHSFQHCTALVMNKKGAGFCLGASGAAAVSAEHTYRTSSGTPMLAPNYSPAADNFAWRKLRSTLISGTLTNFSPKCDDVGCGNATILALPDKSFFPYWAG